MYLLPRQMGLPCHGQHGGRRSVVYNWSYGTFEVLYPKKRNPYHFKLTWSRTSTCNDSCLLNFIQIENGGRKKPCFWPITEDGHAYMHWTYGRQQDTVFLPAHNFAKRWPICAFLSLTDSAANTHQSDSVSNVLPHWNPIAHWST